MTGLYQRIRDEETKIREMLRQPAGPRPSRLAEQLRRARLERALRMSPQERLLLALDMSDLCLDLQLACSVKP